MNEKMNQQLFLIIVLDIFLFFFYFSRYKQFYEFRDNSAKQRLRENRFPNSGEGRNISRSDLFFKKINLIARFLDFYKKKKKNILVGTKIAVVIQRYPFMILFF